MKILLAVDGSECSDMAVREVCERPWPAGSAVKVISIAESPLLSTETWPFPADYYSAIEKSGQDQAHAAIDKAVTQLRSAHGGALEVATRITEGHVQGAILDEADAWDADLIVLGSHGYRGIKRFLLGSVSHAVASHANCSVEIVR